MTRSGGLRAALSFLLGDKRGLCPMRRRYFVVCTGSPAALGGSAVLYDTVALLRESGRDAYVLHMLPNAHYSLSPHKFETAYFSWRLRAGNYVGLSRRVRFRAGLERLFATLKAARNIPYEPRPDDIIIAPDHLAHALQWAFPELKRIVFSQNSFGYLRSYKLGQLYNGAPMKGVVGNLAISDTCIDHGIGRGDPCRSGSRLPKF